MFPYRKVSAFLIYRMSFQHRLVERNPFQPIRKKTFWPKHVSLYGWPILLKTSRVFRFSATQILMTALFKPGVLCPIVIFWPSTRPKNAIPRWCTGRKWHIPMASNRKRSRGRIKAYDMGQGEGPTVPLQWYSGRE